MLIHHLLKDQANSRPDDNALWFSNQWFTYKQLYDKARSVAAFLAANGFQPNQRVALLMDNCDGYAVFYFGVLMAGGVVVGLNPGFSAEDVKVLVKDCRASTLVVDKKHLNLLVKAGVTDSNLDIIIRETDPALGCKTEALWEEVFDFPGSGDEVRRIDQDLAEIVYTSGSTGKPKGVMLSHLNIVSNVRSIAAYMQLTSDDRAMVILPFYYIFGKSILLSHFLRGASVVVDNRFIFPNKIIETMVETEVTNFSGVPSTYSILLSRSNLREVDLPRLRMVTQAGGSMPVALQKEVAQVFAPAKLWVMYGATEAAPRLSYLHPDHFETKLGSIGQPVDNVELQIMDDAGNILPPGEKGEIVARGSNIMLGYWNDEEGTRQALQNGYYHTGDLGYKDADGFIFVVGRKNDIVKVKGFRVSTKEVEEKIFELEEVDEVAVIGVADAILGEALKAYIVLKKEAGQVDKKMLLKRLRTTLPDYKVPTEIALMESLPKNSYGKILKNELKG